MIKFNDIVIPTYSDSLARWNVAVDLSGKRYKFYVSWNTMQEAWMMAIFDVNDNLLIGGIRLVCGVSFLEKYRASVPDLPPGELVLLDMDLRNDADPTRDDLSTRYALVYSIMEAS
jgi:hypothetical protein